MDLQKLAALMQVFQGLQGQNSLGDITQLAQLDQGQRESADKSRYYDQNQALEQRKFEALLEHQRNQTSMGQTELDLRRQAEGRMMAGQNAEIGYRNQNMELQRQKALMMKPYYEQLIAASGVSMEQKQSQMAAIEHFMKELNGGGEAGQQIQLGPGEMQFLKTLAEQFKAQPQPQPTR